MSNSNENTGALLAAAELLLADVQRQREALGRREQELKESVAMYRSRLGNNDTNGQLRGGAFTEVPRMLPNHADDDDSSDQYGAITDAILSVLRESPRKMNNSQIADALKSRNIPIRSKSYIASARTAINRLVKNGKVRRVGVGYFRLPKSEEA